MEPQHKHKFAAVILAAGAGTRMRSDLPKVMHRLAGQPLISHVLSSLKPLSPEQVVVVVAPGMESVKEECTKVTPDCTFAIQDKQQGTGHAVRCALDNLKGFKGHVLVLYGDTPLLTHETLLPLLEEKASHDAAIALLAMRPDNPTGYGRLVMESTPYVERIVEERDATQDEKNIQWVWGGVMLFDADFLRTQLPVLEPSPVTNEYYLTTLVDAATTRSMRTLMVPMSVQEAMGVNDRVQLSEAEKIIQKRLRRNALEGGATMIDPDSVYFSMDTKLGRDVVIEPNVFFGPGVSVADHVQIRANSHIEGARIEKNTVIGPFARIRPGTVIGERARVGNFVELKKTRMGNDAMINHLSYVGDAELGVGVNIGAGTITCNYDSIQKHQTVIGDYTFIGSNTSLVAPVVIGEEVVVGAGSVITDNVENDALAIARVGQVNVPGKGKEIKRRKRKTG